MTLELPDAVRVPFDRLTPLRDWLANPAARERIEPAMAGVPLLAAALDSPMIEAFVADMPIAKLVDARRARRAPSSASSSRWRTGRADQPGVLVGREHEELPVPGQRAAVRPGRRVEGEPALGDQREGDRLGLRR